MRDGRLAGAILLGDTRAAGTLTQLFDRGAALPADRCLPADGRRDGGPPRLAQSPTALPGRATICQCNGVTKAAHLRGMAGRRPGRGQMSAPYPGHDRLRDLP